MSRDLFEKYDVPVPRYTSYPTVPEWHRVPTSRDWLDSLARACATPDASLALYLHLPFCESLCTFCGCNTVITRDHGRARPYAALLVQELDAYLARVPALQRASFSQIHLGGGTPTFSSPDELQDLLTALFERLSKDPGGFEGSVEADPRVTTAAHLDVLRHQGFTRLSLGVQDFNPETQRLVNRVQSPALVTELVGRARRSGFESVNFDLIYGLPGQTLESMHQLADEVPASQPDRLAVYSFARVPWIKPAQRKFKDDQIPVGAAKRALYDALRRRLLDGGYLELGLDHFARPHDGLARAAAAGSMHRNFQGYTERQTTAVLGLGVSAISETPDCYHQNEKVITVYERRVSEEGVPTFRGHLLTPDDQRRRAQILALMTTGRVILDGDEGDILAALAPMAADGLVTIDGHEIELQPAGRPFLRNVATAFDAYLQAAAPAGPTYSRSV